MRVELYTLKMRDIWNFLKNEKPSYWFISFYLFVEYVRPQTLYPSIDPIPFGELAALGTFVALIAEGNTRWVSNSENKLMVMFLAIILFSSTFGLSPKYSFSRLPSFLSWFLIYFLIIHTVTTNNRFFVFILFFLLYNFKMAQFSFRGWASQGFGFAREGTGGGPGWFENSGEFGIQMCMFLPLAVYFLLSLRSFLPTWKKLLLLFFPAFALTGIISSASRGALIGAAAVISMMYFQSKHKLKAAPVVIIIALLAIRLIPEEQKERLSYAGKDATSLARTERWKKGLQMATRYPLLGVGYKNWSIADRTFFGGNGELCHNIFIECLAELGYTGLIGFCSMILFSFVNNQRTRRVVRPGLPHDRFIYYMAHGLDAALVGYLVSGFFVTVFYYPYFWINLAMTAALNSIAMSQTNRKSAP